MTTGPGPGTGRGARLRDRGRSTAALLLITVGVVLTPPAVLAVWSDSVITDTDRYVEVVGPLVDDPAVRSTVARRITAELSAAVDLDSLVGDASDTLTDRGVDDRVTVALEELSRRIRLEVETWLQDRVTEVLETAVFRDTWVRANRAAHAQLVAALSGDQDGRGVVVAEDRVVLELSPVVDALRERLTDRGDRLVDRLPAVDVQIVLLASDQLEVAQRGFDLIDGLGRRLSAAAALCLVLGVLLARNRRAAIVRASAGAFGAMLVLAVAVAFLQSRLLGTLPPEVDEAATRAIVDQVVGTLQEPLRAVLMVTLAIGVLAHLVGPSRSAVAVRSVLGRAGAGRRNSSPR